MDVHSGQSAPTSLDPQALLTGTVVLFWSLVLWCGIWKQCWSFHWFTPTLSCSRRPKSPALTLKTSHKYDQHTVGYCMLCFSLTKCLNNFVDWNTACSPSCPVLSCPVLVKRERFFIVVMKALDVLWERWVLVFHVVFAIQWACVLHLWGPVLGIYLYIYLIPHNIFMTLIIAYCILFYINNMLYMEFIVLYCMIDHILFYSVHNSIILYYIIAFIIALLHYIIL